ncbi:hypothetical protein [Chlorobium phaeovibrioides]|nr:hypothetical protein [Chlorobium phaeovibrioides]
MTTPSFKCENLPGYTGTRLRLLKNDSMSGNGGALLRHRYPTLSRCSRR